MKEVIKLVLIFTGNEQLDLDLSKKIHDSRVVYYPDYVLEENDANILIIAVQNNKFDFKDFMFKVREKNIRIILLLENNKQDELNEALLLGIYDILFNPFSLEDIENKISFPSQFSDICQYILPLMEVFYEEKI